MIVVSPSKFFFSNLNLEPSHITHLTNSILAFLLKAPGAYPYPDPYYRSIFAPYDAQPYPPQPYGGQPMVCSL